MNTESDTPRIDEFAECGFYSEMINHAEQLERERKFIDLWMITATDHQKQRVDLKIVIAEMMQLPNSYFYNLGKQALEKLWTQNQTPRGQMR